MTFTIYRVGEALIFGSWMLGQALAYAPNVNAAIVSASRIKKVLERIPKIGNPFMSTDTNFEVCKFTLKNKILF